MKEVMECRGMDSRFDVTMEAVAKVLAQSAHQSNGELQASARNLVTVLARTLQGATLLKHGTQATTELFMETRFGSADMPFKSPHFGTLPASSGQKQADIIQHHMPF